MTQEKVCFRYDGSEDSRKCIEWINKGKPMCRHCCGFNDELYAPDGSNSVTSDLSTHRLVPPSEFLRIVTGETEWTPKYGEEVEVSDNLINWHKHIYIGKNPIQNVLPYIIVTDDGRLVHYKHLRPVRKSLREEINKIVQDWLLSKNHYDLADRIIELVKSRKDEL